MLLEDGFAIEVELNEEPKDNVAVELLRVLEESDDVKLVVERTLLEERNEECDAVELVAEWTLLDECEELELLVCTDELAVEVIDIFVLLEEVEAVMADELELEESPAVPQSPDEASQLAPQ